LASSYFCPLYNSGFEWKQGEDYTVKKGYKFLVPIRDVTDQTLLAGNNLARDSLVSDIPAGDGKLVNLFYSALILG
jgi:hypothetical protein